MLTTWDWSDVNERKYLEAGVQRFSSAKTVALHKQMNRALLQANGDYSNFKRRVDTIGVQYNEQWLQSEVQIANSRAQTAARWQRFVDEADVLPYLRYVTIGDEKVRHSHKELDGRTFEIGSRAADLMIPPLGWGCRCDVVQTDQRSKHITDDTAEDALGTEQLKAVRKHGFDKNPGKTLRLFDENSMYVKRFRERSLTHSDWGLTKFAQMAGLQRIILTGRSTQEQQDYFRQRAGTQDNWLVLDDVRIDYDTYMRIDAELVDKLRSTISGASEVWQWKDGVNYGRVYITFYASEALYVKTLFSKTGIEQVSKFQRTKQVDRLRKGLLVVR